MLRLCITALLFSVAFLSQAQNPAALKKNGEKAFLNGRWAEALAQLEQYQQAKPGDFGVLTRLGICHYRLHHGPKALEYLSYVAAKNTAKPDPECFYFLGRTLHGMSEFGKAAEAYKQYLRVADARHGYRGNATDNLLRCLNGALLAPNDAVALVENLGNRINTAGDEFAPLPSVNHPGRLYYAAARAGCNGGLRNDQGYEDTLSGHWCADIFYARKKPDGWEDAGAMSGLINSPRHEVALAFGKNGQILYFFRGFTLFAGDILADTAEIKDEYALEPPRFDSPVRGENGDGALFFFNDSTLLFAGRHEGGYGGLDLYITRMHDSLWTEPVNLGPEINSAYDETTPFLARDGRTLYFSSNRTESMGGLDVFRAVFVDAEGAWQNPVNLGSPLNSPADDAWFQLSADGLSAVFASGRLDNYGERDLYAAYFKTEQPEQLAPGSPPIFADAQAAAGKPEAISEITLPALYYHDDKDLTGPENQPALAAAVEAARLANNGTLVITVHTDATGPAKFDLYYGIKRAEIVGKALTERGITPDRIVLRSAGPAFPAARTVVGAEDYPAGAILNRRAEIRMATAAGRLPFSVLPGRRDVPEAARAGGAGRFDELSTGLVFKVELVAARQVLTTDALAMFEDVMIETAPGEGVYHYTAGNLRTYAETVKLRKDLQNAGFPDAAVAAYVDGLRIDKADAVGLLKRYPELTGFIRG